MTRSAAQILVATAVALSVLVAGCSGDDDGASSPDTPDWSRAANARCAAVDPVPLPADTLVDLDQLPDDELQQVLASYRLAADDATALVSELEELAGAPGDAAPLLSELANDVALLDAALDVDPDGGTDGVAFAGARLRRTGNAVAGELDLDECRDRVGTWSTSPPSSQPLRPDVVCLQAPGFVDDLFAPDASPLDDAQPIVCEEPHDVERYLTFDARAGNGEEYPGQIFLSEQAVAQCDATFDIVAGAPAVTDPSSYVAVVPDASAWQSGRRQITCVRVDPDGKQLARSVPDDATPTD